MMGRFACRMRKTVASCDIIVKSDEMLLMIIVDQAYESEGFERQLMQHSPATSLVLSGSLRFLKEGDSIDSVPRCGNDINQSI